MTSEPKHDLLTDPIFTWRRGDGSRSRGSLPDLLYALETGDAIDFCRARAHQWHIVGMFFAQTAYHVIDHVGARPENRGQWREGLLSLTDGDTDAWHLVVPDETRSAFMQPRDPFGARAPTQFPVTPDGIDTPVNTKNIVSKGHAVAPDDPEAWTLALITGQTSDGYSGGPFRQVSRMPKPSTARLRVGIYPALDCASMFRRDVEVLLHQDTRRWVRDHFPDAGDLRLMWLISWNDAPLQMQVLAPHYIEVCRRVRLDRDGERLSARVTPGDTFSDLKTRNGITGDPWTPVFDPVGKKKPCAFDLGVEVFNSGLTYRRISVLMSGRGVQKPPAQRLPLSAASKAFWIVAALGRPGGINTQTRGPFERVVEVPVEDTLFMVADKAPNFVELEKIFVDETAVAERRLRLGLAAVASHLKKKPLKEFKNSIVARFRSRVDAQFFERLLASIKNYDPDADVPVYEAWKEFLCDLVQKEIEISLREFPLPVAEQAKRLVAARAAARPKNKRKNDQKKTKNRKETV